MQDAALLDDGAAKPTPSAGLAPPRSSRNVRTLPRSEKAEASLAVVEKERGNAAFRAGHAERAEAAYSRAISADPTIAASWANRAMARLKTKDPRGAEADATQALTLLGWPEHDESVAMLAGKCLMRRSAARVSCGRLREALSDACAALEAQPSSSQAKAQVERVRAARLAAVRRAATTNIRVRVHIDTPEHPEGRAGVAADPVESPAEVAEAPPAAAAPALPAPPTAPQPALHGGDGLDAAHDAAKAVGVPPAARSAAVGSGDATAPDLGITPSSPAARSPGTKRKGKGSKKRSGTKAKAATAMGGFELEAAVARCRDNDARWALLAGLGPGGVGGCFRRSGGMAMDGDFAATLLATVQARAEACEGDLDGMREVAKVLRGLAGSPGWDVTVGMLETSAVVLASRAVAMVQETLGEEADRGLESGLLAV